MAPALIVVSPGGDEGADTRCVETFTTRVQLFNAPHRLLFFIGVCNLGLAMAWWALWLAGLQLGSPLPVPAVPPA